MENQTKINRKKMFLLSLAALGVVYGDIGTSPLYAVNELFFGHAHSLINRLNILGSISLIFWVLTLAISIKYIIFVLRADNDGSGGVFALYGLIDKLKTKSKWIISVLLIVSSGFLFGEGIITPAISVVSAMEGLKMVTTQFAIFIVPLTIIILTILFFIQSKGTDKIGSLFGPIITIWFVCIGFLGLNQVIHHPDILQAINPFYAIEFILTHTIRTIFLTFGSVILVITGGEALYADMGHFGRFPIRLTWFSLVYPALLFNYLGQGAYLLSGRHVLNGNIFYSLVPVALMIPMVILATLATIVASQALISGGIFHYYSGNRIGVVSLYSYHSH